MSRIEALFLAGRPERLFCVAYPAERGPARRSVLVLPPFGEEMNKCRRMVALGARALQARGCDVLVPDLSCTGDSEGEFGDARLETWSGDLKRGAEWLQERSEGPLDLLAVRGGALLVSAEILPADMQAGRLVLWQPVTNGRQLVTQFLRLRAAETLVGSTQAPEQFDARAILRSVGHLEVAGYEVSEALIAGLEVRDLPAISRAGWREVLWCDVAASGTPALSPASQRSVATLRANEIQVDAELFEGEPFWGTPEIAVVRSMIERTAAYLAERV
jgi:exosortase A-associated hydrolase 2